MALTDDVHDLAARILASLDEARDFYLHTRQAWRVLQQLAHEGRSVGIVDRLTGQEVLASDLTCRSRSGLPSTGSVVPFHRKPGQFGMPGRSSTERPL
jgi:hypothetical protein